MPEIEAGSVVCKANSLPAVLLFWLQKSYTLKFGSRNQEIEARALALQVPTGIQILAPHTNYYDLQRHSILVPDFHLI